MLQNNWVENFLSYLRFERNRSEHTVKSYAGDLSAFCSYVTRAFPNCEWQQVDSGIIRSWMEQMVDEGNKASSVNRRLSALRAFYRYCLQRNKVTVNPVSKINGLKTSKVLPRFIREPEMNTLLDSFVEGQDYLSELSHIVVMLFYETGIRLSELIGLDEKDIDFSNARLKVLGKRNKERFVPFGAELSTALQHYISVKNVAVTPVCSALFVNAKGERLSRSMVRRIVIKELSRVSTQQKRSPHVLRHTFATSMLNHGAGLESVKHLLGHENLATTEIYTHTTFNKIKQVYSKAHPRADK